jgi:hypothetical protein
MPQILRHGTSGFTSHPKEGVLRICIALKNPSPWPGKHTNHYTTKATTKHKLVSKKSRTGG